jgi:hypothetical protein
MQDRSSGPLHIQRVYLLGADIACEERGSVWSDVDFGASIYIYDPA